jgi:hypothetical protein
MAQEMEYEKMAQETEYKKMGEFDIIFNTVSKLTRKQKIFLTLSLCIVCILILIPNLVLFYFLPTIINLKNTNLNTLQVNTTSNSTTYTISSSGFSGMEYTNPVTSFITGVNTESNFVISNNQKDVLAISPNGHLVIQNGPITLQKNASSSGTDLEVVGNNATFKLGNILLKAQNDSITFTSSSFEDCPLDIKQPYLLTLHDVYISNCLGRGGNLYVDENLSVGANASFIGNISGPTMDNIYAQLDKTSNNFDIIENNLLQFENSTAIMFNNSNSIINNITYTIQTLQQTMQQQNASISVLQQIEMQQTANITALQQIVSQQNESIAALEQTVFQQTENISALQLIVSQQSTNIANLQQIVSQQTTSISNLQSITSTQAAQIADIYTKLPKYQISIYGPYSVTAAGFIPVSTTNTVCIPSNIQTLPCIPFNNRGAQWYINGGTCTIYCLGWVAQ